MILRQRRFLPNLSLLLAFDAVMRRGSVTGAAQDLGLTQSTISRLLQSLEAQLGQSLFTRHKKRLTPTEAAQRYFRDISGALDIIQRAGMSLIANPDGGTLDLAVLPTFATRWLAPRLPGFLAAHPGVTINLGTRLRPFDFSEEGFDAAIHFGAPTWPDAGFAKLFDERMVALAAPGFLASHPVRGPRDLVGLPLLQLETRPDAWGDWLAYHGVDATQPLGMLFDQFAPMIQAAIYGVGVALLPEFLARAELADGRLVAAWGGAVPSRGSYYLVWPLSGAAHPPLIAFRNWLLSEVRGEKAEDIMAW